MLGQRRRRWPSIKPALGQRVLLTGMVISVDVLTVMASSYNNLYMCGTAINLFPAELLQLYFSSFEAGIANAIPSFK